MLFEKLLEEFSYPDSKIAKEVAAGFPLCGWLPPSSVFPAKSRAPDISEAFLRKMACSFSARTVAATSSSGDKDADNKLWQATLDEVAEGFLIGPLSLSELGSKAWYLLVSDCSRKTNCVPSTISNSSSVNSAVQACRRSSWWTQSNLVDATWHGELAAPWKNLRHEGGIPADSHERTSFGICLDCCLESGTTAPSHFQDEHTALRSGRRHQ